MSFKSWYKHMLFYEQNLINEARFYQRIPTKTIKRDKIITIKKRNDI